MSHPRSGASTTRATRTGGHRRRIRLQSLPATANPEFTATIADLGDALGTQAYESLARSGGTMTSAAMVTLVDDQIDQARTGLTDPWELS